MGTFKHSILLGHVDTGTCYSISTMATHASLAILVKNRKNMMSFSVTMKLPNEFTCAPYVVISNSKEMSDQTDYNKEANMNYQIDKKHAVFRAVMLTAHACGPGQQGKPPHDLVFNKSWHIW